jgi:hypothetical protein
MIEDNATGQCGLVHTTPKKEKMTIALNSANLTQYLAAPQLEQQACSMYLPATKALEYEMGSEEDKLVTISDFSPVLPLFHKTTINRRPTLADGNSIIQATSHLSLTAASKRADNDNAARHNLSDISQTSILGLVVIGLDEDFFPLIEWNNEEADKSMQHTMSQSSFSPILSPSFRHDKHNSHHRLLRSKSFVSKLVALETLQTPISY